MLFLRKNKFLAVIFWLLCIAVMYVIFMFSSATGEESEEVSQNLLSKIVEFIGNFITHNTLRKLAHFSEFAALGFCFSGAIHYTFGKKKFYLPLIPSFVYAVSDEIHQYFVPERACALKDVVIDSAGALLAVGVFTAAICFITPLKKYKKFE